MSEALSMGGSANFTVRSRHTGKMRSRQRPHRSRLTDHREFDRLARQALGFTLEQRRGRHRRLVATPCPASPEVARLTFCERRPRGRPGGFGKCTSVINELPHRYRAAKRPSRHLCLTKEAIL
jgi:hypothetical protein